MTKLSTHSGTVAVTVMVPNSLGPGELLAHYGTDEQKRHYLPRLAKGLEIPCFALTNPNAGSDAASIPDFGIVCWGEHEGKRVLGLRVTWDKRYITLGPVATLLGLAFRAYDPDHLVGDKEDIGITCALIPTSHPGVEIGRRHMPLNAVFQNGPNWGKDVFIPMDWVIGGQPMLGPRLADADGVPRRRAAASRCRRRPPAWRSSRARDRRLRARAHAVQDADRQVRGHRGSAGAHGRQPLHDGRDAHADRGGDRPGREAGGPVRHRQATTSPSAAAQVVNDAMDIVGGKGICMGPSNFLGAAYMQLPVAITVEGANILTRSLIIFGQGAIRCHPYVLKEMEATREADRAKASIAFDAALFGHVRFTLAEPGAHARAWASPARTSSRVPARRRAGDAPLLPAAHALLGGARVPRRRLDGHAGRRAEAQGEALGAPGRHPVAAVPVLGDAQALRGRRPAGTPTRR